MIHLLRGTVALLIALGVISGLARAGNALRPAPVRPGDALTGPEREAVDLLTAITPLEPGTPAYRNAEETVAGFNATYSAHRVNTFMHALPGALLLLLAPLQFSKRIRSRFRTFHRWLGRLLVSLVVAIGASAFYFGLFTPFGGVGESAAVIVFGGFFAFAAVSGFLAIRRRQIPQHREWMIRMFSLAVGISTVRIVNLLLLMMFPGKLRETFVPSLWLGFGASLLIAELWIRRTRVTPRQEISRKRATYASMVQPGVSNTR